MPGRRPMKADGDRAAQAARPVPVVAASAAPPADLSTEEILGQVETAVVALDRDGCLRYANVFASTLLGYENPQCIIGEQFRSLGFDGEYMGKVKNLEQQVHRGRDWEGTLSITRPDTSKFLLKITASPLRASSGSVTGTMLTARQAVQLGTKPGFEKFGLLDLIGARLGSTLELDVTLTGVAQTLVPQFADHCFIDLYQTEGFVRHLVRRIQMSAWGWEPGKGRWNDVGEPVSSPPGRFCR